MWQLEFEQNYKRMKIAFFALVLLTIVLSVGIFLTSFTLVKQIGVLQGFIPALDLNQRITAQMLSLRLEVTQYMQGGKQKNIEFITSPLKVISQLAEERSEKSDNQAVKDNMMKVSMKIDGFLKEIKAVPEDKVVAKTKDLINKIDNLLSNPRNSSEIDDVIGQAVRIANTSVVISLFIAIFIGGGMFLGMIVYLYLSRKQMEKIDQVMSMSMVDETTRIYNKHYFEERLMESLNRVQRFKKPLAVLFIKLEIPVNIEKDAYPVILREVAVRLEKSTRAYDINARFSERVFASIVQEVEEKETNIVVTRLKNAFEQKEITGKIEESKKTRLIERMFGLKKHPSKQFSTYIKVVIGGLICRDEKFKVSDMLLKSEEIIKEAEASKDQIKITSLAPHR